MRLVSICVVILLAFPLAVGLQASSIIEFNDSVSMTLASARSTPCTTPAGAFDTYAKAVLVKNGCYRAMCAPEDMQDDILSEMLQTKMWETGLEGYADSQEGYYIYNLMRVEDNAYEGLLVLDYPPAADDPFLKGLAIQNLRVEKENGRWVVIPLEDFRFLEASGTSLNWGDPELPGITYSGESNDIRIKVLYQTVHIMDNTVTDQNELWFLSSSYYNTTPKPHAEFTSAYRNFTTKCTYIGSEADKAKITHLGLSTAPVYEGEERPDALTVPSGDYASGGSNSGEQWISKKLYPSWGPTLTIDGGGSSIDMRKKIKHPEYYAADLYINGEKVAELDLVLGGAE